MAFMSCVAHFHPLSTQISITYMKCWSQSDATETLCNKSVCQLHIHAKGVCLAKSEKLTGRTITSCHPKCNEFGCVDSNGTEIENTHNLQAKPPQNLEMVCHSNFASHRAQSSWATTFRLKANMVQIGFN